MRVVVASEPPRSIIVSGSSCPLASSERSDAAKAAIAVARLEAFRRMCLILYNGGTAKTVRCTVFGLSVSVSVSATRCVLVGTEPCDHNVIAVLYMS